MLQNNAKLKSLIMSLWNTLYGGGISNPITAIEQITYLLFIKRLDEIENKRELEAKSTGKQYISKFSGTYIPWIDEKKLTLKQDITEAEKDKIKKEALSPRPKTELRWSYFKDMTPASDMLPHFKNNVFPFIKELNGEISPFTQYMEDASFVIKKPSLLTII